MNLIVPTFYQTSTFVIQKKKLWMKQNNFKKNSQKKKMFIFIKITMQSYSIFHANNKDIAKES